MALACLWLICLAGFLELAHRAPEIDAHGRLITDHRNKG